VFASIYGPSIVRIADIDGDGKPDLIVLSYNDVNKNYDAQFNVISVLRNSGTIGVISFDKGVIVDSGHGNYSGEDIAIGDLDGDGKPDIVASLYINGAVVILRNTSTPGSINSNNSFAPGVFYYVNAYIPLTNSVCIGDLDGDGKPEIVVSNNEQPFISIFYNTCMPGSISFDPNVNFPSPYSQNNSSIAIGDLNGDGKLDIVETSTDSIHVFQNTSTPGSITTNSFAPYVTFNGGYASGLNDLAIADLDGDGRADIAVANSNQAIGANIVSVLHNAVSSIATLDNLTVSQGNLTPVFAKGTLTYADTVINSVTSITVTPTFTDSTSTISVNGVAVISGTASGDIPLVVGSDTITVVVTAQNGTTKDTYTIIIYRLNALSDMSANNVITPNGDGKNDYWIIKDINLYPQNNVTVFDKAGRVVYSKHGYNNDWGGTLNGAPLAQDTYYYIVNLGPNQPKFKGFISILRN
jgi:gliding motility-associated-like protein